jgi:hypothetical protein
MITASIDRSKLERSLKRFSRDFGDSNAQALCRWGVQACRELAGATQVFGTGSSKAKKQQWNSIEAGARTVLNIVQKISSRNANALKSVQEVSDWIDSQRKSKGHTRKVPASQRPTVTEAIFKKTMTERKKAAGIAKGGWIGAGHDIANAQKGSDRIYIGKNFLGYAQKHAKLGASRRPVPGWRPSAEIINKARHVADAYVLQDSNSKRAIAWSLKKTVKWYSSALKRQDQKQKP